MLEDYEDGDVDMIARPENKRIVTGRKGSSTSRTAYNGMRARDDGTWERRRRDLAVLKIGLYYS